MRSFMAAREGGPAYANDPQRDLPTPGKRTLTEQLPSAPGRKSVSGGLPDDVRAMLEQSFGYDLSSVRVHQDGKADAMGARAFAFGGDLHFGAGEYAPHSDGGMELLAHEISHVIQQASGGAPKSVQAKISALFGHDPHEAEADAMAARAVRGEPARSDTGGALRPLPSMTGGVPMPKLRVDGDWIKTAEVTAELLSDHGGDAEIVRILKAWAADNIKEGRTFGNWAQAIAAARENPGPASAQAQNAGPSMLKKILVLFLIFCLMLGLFVPIFYMGSYQARPGMDGTSHVARRELEPLMQARAQGQITQLAQSAITERLRAEIQNPRDALKNNPTIEQLFPGARRQRQAEEALDQIGPQLEMLEPVLKQVEPVLDQIGPNELDNPANSGVYHEHIFLGPRPTTSPADHGSPLEPQQEPTCASKPTDVGFFHHGVHEDRPDLVAEYGPPIHHYDSALMERAALEVAKDFGKYKGMTHNCQDYVDAVVTAYKDLGGKEIVPTRRAQVILALTDIVIDWAGYWLEAEIDTAVGQKLAALPPSGSDVCAKAVADKLGLDAKEFGGAIEAVLGGELEIPSLGGKVTLRKALCEAGPQAREAMMDHGIAQVHTALAQPIDLPEEGLSSVKDALCTPKGPQKVTVLEGTVFEVARVVGGADIEAGIPALIASEPLAKNKLATELTRRLGANLYRRLNLKGLCS